MTHINAVQVLFLCLPLLPSKLNKRTGANQFYDEALAQDALSLRMMLIPASAFLMGS